MLKYAAALLSAILTTSPALPSVVLPKIEGVYFTTISVGMVIDSKDGAHTIALRNRHGKMINFLVAGCPLPVAKSPYYLIGLPGTGVFMTPTDKLEYALMANGGDFAKASRDLIASKDMCVVAAAKEVTVA